LLFFKPEDEEPFAPNNPRGFVGKFGQQSFRRGILSGDAAPREVAAFIVDHKGFAGVPITTRVETVHQGFCYNNGPMSLKVGSLQEFVQYDEVSGDLAPQCFPVWEVHKIGILDIRLANTDRNDANILVQRNSSGVRLVPVDHGYCLPDLLEIAWCDWCWLSWPQAQIPFDEEARRYIKEIDIEADVQLLKKKLSIRESSLNVMRITNKVLQVGAEHGMCLFQIASLISRDDLEKPSMIEVLVSQAQSLASSVKARTRSSMVRSNSMFLHVLTDSSVDIKVEPEGMGKEFWRYFDVLLEQLIERKVTGAVSGTRSRRHSCSMPIQSPLATRIQDW